MNTTPLGPFLGINTRRPDFDLVPNPRDSHRFLRSAVNVDIDNAGHLRRRPGTALVQAMSNAHSLYMWSTGNGFLVRGSALYAITLPAYSETLLKVLTSDARMSYQHYGDGDHYFSNGTDAGRVTAGVAYPMGLPTPASPAIANIGGALLLGWYQIGLSYSNAATGEEGGISPSSNVNLTATGGIRVTLPGAATGATHVNIYLSDSNGTVPRLHQTVVASATSIDLTVLATGRPTNGRFEMPLPAGQLINANGRLCSYSGKTLYVGLPYRPGYYLPVEGYIPFPDTIAIAAVNQHGVYVAADKTYWIPGDIGEMKETIRDVLPYGAVPGTAFRFKNQTMVGWFSEKGLVIGSPDGSVDASMADSVVVSAPTIGVSCVYDDDEFRRVVSCGYAMNLTTKAVTTYTGFDFSSMALTYATKADGIYSTNATGVADATIGLGKINFGSELFKFMPNTYLGVDSLSKMKIRIQAPPALDFTYSARDAGAGVQMQRIDVGRGLKSNWFDLTISNTAGADFKLVTVSFTPVQAARRI